MTTPNDEGPKELADMPHLSDVQATDALLDRLAARTPTTDDLDDPVIADLVLLTEFADASPVPPPGIDRLIEVLGGRPLYMFDRGSAAATEADEPIQLDADVPAARMIDLSQASTVQASTVTASTGGGAVTGGGASQDDEVDGVAARATGSEDGSPATALAVIRSIRSGRRPMTKAGWQGVLQQAALPAASVVALLALGGGVSAVVTGDPMSPVYGITKVASALPGIDNPSEKKLKSAKRDVQLATAAAGDNKTSEAQKFLASAKSKVDDVPQENQQQLAATIESLSIQVSAAASTPSPSPVVPTPSVTSTPVETPEPTQAPVTDPPTTTPETSTPADTTTTSPSAGSDATVDGAGTDANAAGA